VAGRGLHPGIGVSDKTAPVLGPLLGYEVLTAFFLEAGFLGVMLFGVEVDVPAGGEPERLQHGEVARQPDGEGREQEVPQGCGEGRGRSRRLAKGRPALRIRPLLPACPLGSKILSQ
jgi:hypothetical protein